MNSETIVIGSRESVLAMVQTRMVLDFLQRKYPQKTIEILSMRTTGDKILDRTLDKIGGKGLFVKELDHALLENRTDLSVHSLKDLPMEVSGELPVLCFSKREDPRDVLVLPKGRTEPDFSKPIGTASGRRVLQLQKVFPEAEFAPIRGNLQTRLKKLDDGQYGAIVLAAAGLKRLGLEERISRYFTPDEVIPAAGQGILAVQGRTDADRDLFTGFADADAADAAECERAFVSALDGGCSSPIAAYAEVNGERITLRGFYADEKGETTATGRLEGNRKEAAELGRRLAAQLLREAKSETQTGGDHSTQTGSAAT